jgi:hypothetical protein
LPYNIKYNNRTGGSKIPGIISGGGGEEEGMGDLSYYYII